MKTFCSLLLFVSLFTGQIKAQDASFENSKIEVVMRMIGHQLLLNGNDSTSRVLPIKKLSENIYQLRFNTQIEINPDSLVAIVQKQILSNNISTSYIVKAKDCLIGEIQYSYAILNEMQNELIPCKGRILPKNCYFIQLELQVEKENKSRNLWPVIPITAIVLFILILLYKRKRGNSNASMEPIIIGQFLMDTEKECLYFQKEKIDLSNKEFKLLSIFAKNLNQIVDRERLQKEVWEDEGVIVGRSLDVFISKLRKKLDQDPQVKLKNIHGKGYKLEILEPSSN